MLIISALQNFQAKLQAVKEGISEGLNLAFLDGDIFLFDRARCVGESHRE